MMEISRIENSNHTTWIQKQESKMTLPIIKYGKLVKLQQFTLNEIRKSKKLALLLLNKNYTALI